MEGGPPRSWGTMEQHHRQPRKPGKGPEGGGLWLPEACLPPSFLGTHDPAHPRRAASKRFAGTGTLTHKEQQLPEPVAHPCQDNQQLPKPVAHPCQDDQQLPESVAHPCQGPSERSTCV